MKKKIVLAVVVAAVVLAAAFALHRPQAGTQPTPEPTRQAETNDAVPAEPTCITKHLVLYAIMNVVWIKHISLWWIMDIRLLKVVMLVI